MFNPKNNAESSSGKKAEKERLNLYLPKSLVDELRAMIPARERTQFVADVLACELRRRRLLLVIEKSYGAWKDDDHPNMATGADIDRWLQEQRN